MICVSAALAAEDFNNAGRRAYEAGWVHALRGQAAQVLACAQIAEVHWNNAQVGARERADVSRLRGIGHQLGGDFVAAIAVFREVVNIDRWLNRDSEDVATDLNTLAGAEYAAGDLDAAERDFREALRIARLLNYRQVISSSTGNLAGLALVRGNWTGAEALASEALAMAQGVGKRESIALNSHRLASALVRQGKKSEAAHMPIVLWAS